MLMGPGGAGASHDFRLREVVQNHSPPPPSCVWLVCAEHCASSRDMEVLKPWASTTVGGAGTEVTAALILLCVLVPKDHGNSSNLRELRGGRIWDTVC